MNRRSQWLVKPFVQPKRRVPRVVRSILLLLALAVMSAAVLFGPHLTFHLLPHGVTAEEERLAALLEAEPGKTIAEIGAGRGALSIALAERLLPGGTLYSTELDPERRAQIRDRAQRARSSNVVVIESEETRTGLPDRCCDAIFMRNVYHHITVPESFNASVGRAIRPDGRLAVIDFEPGALWSFRPPSNAARLRAGHGVGRLVVAEDFERAGFRMEQIVENWGGRLYLVSFRALPADP